MSRRFVILIAVALVTLSAGCSGIIGNGGDWRTDGSSITIENETRDNVYNTVTGSLNSEETAAFTRAISDDSGSLTPEGRTLLDQLEQIGSQ
jgi:hypothetical protein